MENLYFWFNTYDNSIYEVFSVKHGYLISFLILFFSSIVFCSIYYLWLGKTTDRFSNIGSWFVFGLINMFVVLIATLSVLAFGLGETTSFPEIHSDFWIFSIVNGLIYGFIFYFIVSILINSFSSHSKFIPFNIFK